MNRVVVFTPNKITGQVWLPALWCQAKTYYEKHGKKVSDWQWIPCYADTHSYDEIDQIKRILEDAKPDVFAISLYMWNVEFAFEVAQWVKQRWPKCLIISGGPHQDFKYNNNWFLTHPYIDASLPGDCYGELAFQEILDNYNNGTVDWNQVTDIRYPKGKTKWVTISKKTSKISDKKLFDYQWPGLAAQGQELLHLISYKPNVKYLAIIETTRGCPYGCTYCDWGGGINTAVIKKDLEHVYADLEFLTSINLYFLYISDANFGIFKDRDVDIIKRLVDLRNQREKYFQVGYGGFAKTNNRLDTILEILQLDIENKFSYGKSLKVSQQTLDQQVLDNIDRKNIDLDLMLEKLFPLTKKHNYGLVMEMIMGLPGITLDKFYYELDVLSKNKLTVRWYEWLLLPETPAYNPAYRKKFGMQTIVKTKGWAYPDLSTNVEIVVGADSYSEQDYLKMMLAASFYIAAIQGGMFSYSLDWIQKHTSFSSITQQVLNEFVDWNEIEPQWQNILKNQEKSCLLSVGNNKVFAQYYFAAKTFLDTEFTQRFATWLIDYYECPKNLVKKDLNQLLTVNNSTTTVEQLLDHLGLYERAGRTLHRYTLLERLGKLL